MSGCLNSGLQLDEMECSIRSKMAWLVNVDGRCSHGGRRGKDGSGGRGERGLKDGRDGSGGSDGSGVGGRRDGSGGRGASQGAYCGVKPENLESLDDSVGVAVHADIADEVCGGVCIASVMEDRQMSNCGRVSEND